ncbi:Hypothetical predicted protein [Podarcis lilfordi]|uniref:Uncharacterized protein n=1 Tax=Podarcis lilfordi TaxID=74358 RepID=A0AA35JW38_9SAUR|nr:Hypothetical predicted protein [Podarcis lilfordi]
MGSALHLKKRIWYFFQYELTGNIFLLLAEERNFGYNQETPIPPTEHFIEKVVYT